MKPNLLTSFSISSFLPLSVIFDVQNAQIIPKLEPSDRMRDQGLCALVFRIAEIVLCINLVLGFGSAQLGQQVLFFNTAFGQLDADLANLIVPFGLIESAPAIPNLQLDTILLLSYRPGSLISRNDGR